MNDSDHAGSHVAQSTPRTAAHMETSPGEPAVVTEGLTKRFGERVAVDRIDIELPAGVVSGFVGPNGAGKTTTIQILLGLMRPTSGTAQVLGHSISQPASYQIGRAS